MGVVEYERAISARKSPIRQKLRVTMALFDRVRSQGDQTSDSVGVSNEISNFVTRLLQILDSKLLPIGMLCDDEAKNQF